MDHQGVDVFNILLSPDTTFSPLFNSDLSGGMGVLQGDGLLRGESERKRRLYRIYRKGQKMKSKPFPITAIPYFAWEIVRQENTGLDPYRLTKGRFLADLFVWSAKYLWPILSLTILTSNICACAIW